MPSRDLCTLGDVVRYLPGYEPNDDTDATLSALITSISTDTYRDTGREFIARGTQPQARIFELTGWDVDHRCRLIDDLSTVDGNTVVELLLEDGTLDQTLDAGAYIALPRSRDAWEPVTELQFPRLVQAPALPAQLSCRKELRITGTWGFPEIPPNIVENVAKLVIVRYVTDVSSTGTELTDSLDNINIAGMFRSATEAIDSFRVPTIG